MTNNKEYTSYTFNMQYKQQYEAIVPLWFFATSIRIRKYEYKNDS